MQTYRVFAVLTMIGCSSAYEPVDGGPGDAGMAEPCAESARRAEAMGYTQADCREVVDCAGVCAGCAYYFNASGPYQPPLEEQCLE